MNISFDHHRATAIISQNEETITKFGLPNWRWLQKLVGTKTVMTTVRAHFTAVFQVPELHVVAFGEMVADLAEKGVVLYWPTKLQDAVGIGMTTVGGVKYHYTVTFTQVDLEKHVLVYEVKPQMQL